MSIAANLAAIASVNAFAAAAVKRIEIEETASKLTKNKQNKLEKYARYAAQAKVQALLETVKLNADFVTTTKIENKMCDVYVVEKVKNYLALALRDDSVKESCIAMIKTMINLANANENMTSDDFRIACTKDAKADKSRAKYIVQNSSVQDLSTVNVQARSTYRALEALNVLKHVTTQARKSVFAIDKDNEVYKLLAAHFA